MGMSQQVNIKRLKQQIINQAAQTSEQVFNDGFPPAYQGRAATEQEALTGETNLKHITPATLNAVLLEKLIPDDPELAPLVEFLRNRQNHEGTQGIGTIEGLAEAVSDWIQQATIAAEKLTGVIPAEKGGTGRTDGKAIPLNMPVYEFGAVGAVALMRVMSQGNTIGGEMSVGLRYSNASGSFISESYVLGTWLCHGAFGSLFADGTQVSVFQRIA